jgi:hypothetical protein
MKHSKNLLFFETVRGDTGLCKKCGDTGPMSFAICTFMNIIVPRTDHLHIRDSGFNHFAVKV